MRFASLSTRSFHMHAVTGPRNLVGKTKARGLKHDVAANERDGEDDSNSIQSSSSSEHVEAHNFDNAARASSPDADTSFPEMDDRDYLAAFELQHRYWTQPYDSSEAHEWMMDRFRLAEQEVSLTTLNTAKEHALLGLYHIYYTCVQNGLVDEGTEDGMEMLRKYVDVKQMIHWTHSTLASIEYARLCRTRANVLAPSGKYANEQSPETAHVYTARVRERQLEKIQRGYIRADRH